MTGRSVTTNAWQLLQTTDLNAILGASRAVRAVAAFVLVLALGGVFLGRFAPFVERAIDESTARPLVSTAYGVAAHGVVGIAGFILAGKLSQYQVFGQNPAALGLLLGLLAVLLAGALGFTVVGSTIVELGGDPSRWAGLVVGALVAGVVAVFDPVVAGVVWLVLVSMGIGGPIREWLHASAADV